MGWYGWPWGYISIDILRILLLFFYLYFSFKVPLYTLLFHIL